MNKLWTNCEQIVNKLWTICEQIMNKLWRNCEQIMNEFVKMHNKQTNILLIIVQIVNVEKCVESVEN